MPVTQLPIMHLPRQWNGELKSFFPYPAVSMKLINRLKNEMLEPVLRYGILKERMSALITDAVRADLLESKGYDTQILSLLIWNIHLRIS